MSMKIGTYKWVYWGMMAAYIFLAWIIISIVLIIFLMSFYSLIVNIITIVIFYDQLDRKKHKETEQVYKVAGLSKWIDNVLYVNDKGTVVINQDRIVEVIPLDANAKVIRDITSRDPDFLRIMASIIADSKYIKDEYKEYEDSDPEVSKNLSQISRVDESTIAKTLGENDPKRFKFKYFLVRDVIKHGMKTVFECSKRLKKVEKPALSIVEHEKELDKISDELEDDFADLDEKDDEKDVVDDDTKDVDDKDVKDTSDKMKDISDDDDEETVVDDSLSTTKELDNEEIEYDEIPDDKNNVVEHAEITVKLIPRLNGKLIDRLKAAKMNAVNAIIAATRGVVYRMFDNDKILSVLDKYGIYTVEHLRNCDKMVISDEIGFTNDEMYEFVKYCENNVKDRAIQYWKDLTPKELRKFCLVKMVEVQIKYPRDHVYLVVYAEPKEIVTSPNILARPFNEVEEITTLDGEIVEPVKRRFDQAIYIMEDEYDNCLNFMPGGTGYLNHYPVYVPLAYGTFVLKGWIGSAIPVMKLIATNYEVQREFDDYKNHLSHDNVLIKAMAGLINHIRSNTILYPQQLESGKHDMETLKDELDRQNQLKLQQMYIQQGSILRTNDIQSAYDVGESKLVDDKTKEKVKEKKSGGLGKYIWIVLVLLSFLLVFVMMR